MQLLLPKLYSIYSIRYSFFEVVIKVLE